MTAIEILLRQPAAQAVGWALLQFVWQGAAVGALTALALLALRRSASDVRYVVAAIGFLPGFAYLRGLDARLVVPRRAAPRTRVEALSVAIAGPYAGVYPFESPGGWNLLGTAVGFSPFDARAGAVLALGDRVRFVEVGH